MTEHEWHYRQSLHQSLIALAALIFVLCAILAAFHFFGAVAGGVLTAVSTIGAAFFVALPKIGGKGEK